MSTSSGTGKAPRRQSVAEESRDNERIQHLLETDGLQIDLESSGEEGFGTTIQTVMRQNAERVQAGATEELVLDPTVLAWWG